MVKYKSRIADRILERKVLGKGAVLIEGYKVVRKDHHGKADG